MINKLSPLYARGIKPIPVIPTIYTDALSYGEQVGIMIKKIDECIDKVNEIVDDNNTFKAELLAELQEFKTTITNQQNTFETNITNQQNTFETNITNQQNTYETNTTTALNTWKTNTEQSLNTWKTQTEGVYQAQIDELEQAFDELAEGIQIELGISDKFGTNTALAISQNRFTEETNIINFENRCFAFYGKSDFIVGSGVRSSDGTIVINPNVLRTDYLKVNEGDVIEYNSYINNTFYVIAFYDVSGDIMTSDSIVGSSANYNIGSVTVPSGAVTAIYSTSNQRENVYVKVISNKALNSIIENIDMADKNSVKGYYHNLLPTYRFTYGFYNPVTEEVEQDDSWLTTPKEYCYGFNVIELSGFTVDNDRYVDFYNENKEFMERIQRSTVGGVCACDIPTGAYYCTMTVRIAQYTQDIYVTLKTSTEPLKLVYEGFSNFVKFGVCGDSLTVGFIGTGTWEQQIRNLYYSWGQNMARRNGNICLNFGYGGATTSSWFTDNEHGWIEVNNADNKCQAYIVAIGTNDSGSIGTISDINTEDYTQNANTFYGNFAKIIQAIHAFAGTAKIFVCTIPYPRNDTNKNTAIRNICELLNYTFLIDLDNEEVRPLYQTIYNEGDYFERHYSPNGYVMYATIVNNLIGKYMTSHPTNFRDLHLIPYGSNNVIN